MGDFTDKYDLEKASYGTSNWNSILSADMDKLDADIHTIIYNEVNPAGEALSKYDAVYVSLTGEYMMGLSVSGSENYIIGFADETVTSGNYLKIRRVGPFTNTSWDLTIGGRVFLSTTVTGGITQNEPDYDAQPLGIATATGTVNISIPFIDASLTGGAEGVTYHNNLFGLDADDHTQYHNNARGDARYYTQAEVDANDITVSGALNDKLNTHKTSDDHDGRYFTEAEIDAKISEPDDRNLFVGYKAGEDHTTGDDNTAIGHFAGGELTSGNYNTFVGSYAGSGAVNNTASNNVCVGYQTGQGMGAGEDENVFVGSEAADSFNSGFKNVIIGRLAGGNINYLESNVFLGYKAGYNIGNVSNKLYIANTDTKTLIYGEFDNNKLGIHQTSPTERLDIQDDSINGAIRIGNTATTNSGTMRWTGSDFEGYDGSTWKSLTVSGGGADTFLELTDTPAGYDDGKYLRSTAAGIEFVTISGAAHDRLHTMTSTDDHSAENWKVFYSDGSGHVQELALSTSGTVLTSHGAAVAPSFDESTGGGDVTKWTTVTTSAAGTVNLTTSDFGKTYVFTSSGTCYYNLPSVDGDDLGAHFRFVRTNSAGSVTISGADSDVIIDSGAGGTLTTISGIETFANIGLQLATETLWISTGGQGHWQVDV